MLNKVKFICSQESLSIGYNQVVQEMHLKLLYEKLCTLQRSNNHAMDKEMIEFNVKTTFVKNPASKMISQYMVSELTIR